MNTHVNQTTSLSIHPFSFIPVGLQSIILATEHDADIGSMLTGAIEISIVTMNGTWVNKNVTLSQWTYPIFAGRCIRASDCLTRALLNNSWLSRNCALSLDKSFWIAARVARHVGRPRAMKSFKAGYTRIRLYILYDPIHLLTWPNTLVGLFKPWIPSKRPAWATTWRSRIISPMAVPTRGVS